MRIAVAGLSLSHPEAFSTIARSYGATIDSVWDYDLHKAAAFAAKFGCEVVSSVAAAAARRPDGAIITCISADHGKTALPFLEAGIPTFVDKPFAISKADLELLCAAAARTGAPLFSSSSLRFARDYVDLMAHLKAGRLGTVLGGTATVCHTIEGYLRPGNTWQDEPHLGGGSIINMGIHGLEPLVAALGPGIASVSCHSGKVHLKASQSEDMAMISLQWADGRVATVQVVCATHPGSYELTVYGTEGSLRAQAPSWGVQSLQGAAFGTAEPTADWGYNGLVRAMLTMFETGAPPVPLAETREISLALLAARLSAAEGRRVALAELA